MSKRSAWFSKVVFSAGLFGFAASATFAGTPVRAVRTTVDLRDGWRFKQGDSLTGAEAPDYDDSSWSTVSVPHSWNRVGYYLTPRDADSNRPEQANKAQGIGWYRLSFTPSAGSAGKRVWLEFDAASRTAEVWLNGVRLGEHRGGFSRFRLDATRALKFGTANVLAVKTDNSKPVLGGSTADTLPLTGDFFVQGGLYRPVRLVFTDPVHIEMLDFGGPGVYAQTASIEGNAAQVAIVTKLRNDAREAMRLTVVTRLLDRAGAVAAERSTPVALAASSATELPQSLTVNRARLWQGMADPYLYRLSVEVRTAEGRVLDATEQSFGIRQMRMDPDKGFFLNGKAYRLHGVGLHQDHEGKGWAGSPADVEKDVALIREMGANTIRLTHYQHGQPIHDLADKYGLILWDEIPLVSAWTLGKETQASPALLANARQQLTELIRQNGNHAAVANWGIANEVDFGNSLPVFLSNPGGPIPDPLPLLAELNALAKQEDPSRATALATCCEGRLFASNVTVPITAPSVDLGGANRYFGWYYGKSEELNAHLESLRTARPGQPLAVTEYGAGGAITMHSDNPLGGPVDSRGRNQPEEYMSFVHEQNWPILKAKPYLWATWLWVAFDFATTIRREGDADDINTKGMITYDRKVKKDVFFYYKANWSDVPTVYVAGRRYVDRAYAVTDVRVYSNAPVTELAVNGRIIGKLADCPDSVCVWRSVRLEAGDNVVTARGKFGSKVVADKISWRLAPEQLRSVRIDAGALMAATSKNGRFGSDNFFDGGDAGTIIRPADYGKPAVPVKIANTADADLLATYRRGRFSYTVPVANGRYDVRLSFVEPSATAGERLFDVTANGKVALRNFDVAATAGGPMAAAVRTFSVEVLDGQLRLSFAPTKGDAIVSAIEVIAQR
jgi:beta-galactosidase